MEEKTNTMAKETSLGRAEKFGAFQARCTSNLELANFRCREIRKAIVQAKEMLHHIHQQSDQLDYLIEKYHVRLK
jgi:hypothetical protein